MTRMPTMEEHADALHPVKGKPTATQSAPVNDPLNTMPEQAARIYAQPGGPRNTMPEQAPAQQTLGERAVRAVPGANRLLNALGGKQ